MTSRVRRYTRGHPHSWAQLGDLWSAAAPSAQAFVGFCGAADASGRSRGGFVCRSPDSPGVQSAFCPGAITSSQEISCEVLAVQGKQAIRSYIYINARHALCIAMNV